MQKTKILQVAFVQRLLPLYRFGFYKALSLHSKLIHYTIFCEQGADTVNNIKTISPKLFEKFTDKQTISWKNTKIFYYSRWKILWQRGVLRLLFARKFDVLLISNNMSHLFYWLLILSCKIRGIKIVFWSHGLQGNETGFKLWLKLKYLGLANINLVYANYNRILMVKKGMNETRIKVVYNSLDMVEQDVCFHKAKMIDREGLKSRHFGNSSPIIIFVSRLEKPKKVNFLLEAISILKDKRKIYNLLVVGEGPDTLYLKNLVDTLNIQDQVIFKGSIYAEEELAKLFYISDVFVSPGNVGLNCIHSLSYGTPVITHDDFRFQNPEVEAIVNLKNGIFFKMDNVLDLAEKIDFWIQKRPGKLSDDEIRNSIIETYNPAYQALQVISGIKQLYL